MPPSARGYDFLLTVKQSARWLKVGETTLRQLIDERQILAVYPGISEARIPASELDAYVRRLVAERREQLSRVRRAVRKGGSSGRGSAANSAPSNKRADRAS